MGDFPQVFPVRQQFAAPQVADIAAEVHRQLEQLGWDRKIQPGQRVAITAGSRGIANIAVILQAAVEHISRLGGQPLIVPAMGSHGGGTAEGQRKLLASYGINEEFCGCPIVSSMETVIVCQAREGFPIHFDKQAFESDHVLVVGRVKPHTRFVGEIESGLMKMMLIGLGKHAGAIIYHRAIQDYSFDQIVRSVGREVLSRCRILGGLAIVENCRDETALIEAVRPQDFETREAQLLELARQWLPRLPFPSADLLLVDEIGKNISGTGMDTNVVGRKFNDRVAAEHEYPKIRYLAVRGLTPATHGNATGIGMAEFCLTRVVQAMDVEATRINCLTGGHPTAAMLPLDYPTDARLLQAVLSVVGLKQPPEAQLMWIRNTLDLSTVVCSRAYYEEARRRPDLEILAEPCGLPLDAQGNLPAFPGN